MTKEKRGLRLFLLSVFLAAAVTATYSNHFHNGFHFDDSHAVVNNIYIKNIRNIPLFFRDGSTFSSLPANQTYRPVVTTTLALDYWAGGSKGLGDTFYFHLSTFLLFLLQGLCMFFFFRKLLDGSAPDERNALAALTGVAWYLLHPANAETVNYIIARSDTLSTFFLLTAFLVFLGWPAGRKMHLYLIPLIFGLLAKPIAAVFVPLLFLYVLLFEEKAGLAGLFKKRNRGGVFSSARKTAPSLLFTSFVLFFISRMNPATWVPGGASPVSYVLTQPYVIWRYFATFFLPLSLSADTDLAPLPGVMDIRFFGGAFFLGLLVYASVALSKREHLRPISFGILWFLITLLPTSLTPLAEVMNDHRTFLPYVGLMLSVCGLIPQALRRLKQNPAFSGPVFDAVVIAVAATCLLAYSYGTYQRNRVWKTEASLWKDVTEKSPRNGRGLMNYGLVLMGNGDYQGAATYFNRALELTPNYSYLHINLGVLHAAMGKPVEAEQYFRNAVSYDPGYPGSYYYYARFLKSIHRAAEAAGLLEKALALASADLNVRHLLMDIYFEKSDPAQLKELAESTLMAAPDDPKALYYRETAGKGGLQAGMDRARQANTPEEFLELSLRYYETGQYQKSAEAAAEALKLKPDYDLAYNNICAAYNQLRMWDKAIAAGEKAVRLNPNNLLAKNNLAWAKSQKDLSAGRR